MFDFFRDTLNLFGRRRGLIHRWSSRTTGLRHNRTRQLLARARAGDAPAFCRLIEPLQARLLRQAVALAGDVSAAEDLVSETLVEAWKSLPRYDETCRFSTWLYAILLHRHQKSARRARSRPLALAWLPPSEREDLHERQDNLPSPELRRRNTRPGKMNFIRQTAPMR